MDNRFSLVAFAALLVAGPAFAGYAQVTPPPNWTTSAGAAMYKAASNDVSFSGGVRGAAGVVNVGGRAVAMPAAYRFAANAGQIAARAAFLNPMWFVGATALTLAYQYYSAEDFVVDQGIWKKRVDGVECLSNCFEYAVPATVSVWRLSPSAACLAYVPAASQYQLQYVNGVCQARYWYGYWGAWQNQSMTSRAIPPYNTSSMVPVSQPEFEGTMSPIPLPSGVPQEFPIPLPVEPVPILNPSPGDSPVPQPMRVPMGEPVPVPNTNPQQWKTPVVDLVPKPLTPWVVDLQPKDITKESPTPLPDSEPVPVTPPAGQEEAPVTPDLCEKNPDILACQKIGLGTLEPSVITSTDQALTITKDTGWGPENGTCPAPKTAVVMGVQLSLPFTMLCDFAAGIRPLLIGFAWLSAALTFIGFGRKD